MAHSCHQLAQARPGRHTEALRRQHAEIWELVHASLYTELAPILAALIPGLEAATRTAASQQDRAEARELLGDTYRATAAMMAKIGETDAAWIAADRAGFCAGAAGSPQAVAASTFRMAHVFVALGQVDQAHHVAASIAAALEPKITGKAEPAVLSLYGVAAARDNQRARAHQHLDTARKIAGQLGEDDPGQAIELAQHVTPGSLSPERQARYPMDLAQAHAMRRQIGEALHALTEAERIAPEETRVHYVGRAVTRDLLQLSGLRPRPELRDLAERFGVLP